MSVIWALSVASKTRPNYFDEVLESSEDSELEEVDAEVWPALRSSGKHLGHITQQILLLG